MAKGINFWVATAAVFGLLASAAAATLLAGLLAAPQSAAFSATASGSAWVWAARWGLHLLRLAAAWI